MLCLSSLMRRRLERGNPRSFLGGFVWLTVYTRKKYSSIFYRSVRNFCGSPLSVHDCYRGSFNAIKPQVFRLSDWIRRGVVSVEEALAILQGTLTTEKQERYELLEYYLDSGFLTIDDITFPESLKSWREEESTEVNTIKFL